MYHGLLHIMHDWNFLLTDERVGNEEICPKLHKERMGQQVPSPNCLHSTSF
jgi:hypothetical protein